MSRRYSIGAVALLVMAGSGVAVTAAIGPARASGHTPAAVVKNLVRNGSFESPKISPACANGGESNPTPGICTYFGGSTGVSDWTVGSDSVDMTSAPVWKAAAGSQSIDLSGDGPGSLTQKVATARGKKYILRWAGAGNWDCGQKIKSMVVYWDGAIVKATNFNTSGHSGTKMGWVSNQVTVAATGKTSTIEFADATADRSICGSTLDNVSLTAAA